MRTAADPAMPPGHGPSEPKLVLDIMKRNVAWFDKHLRGDATAK